MASSSIIQVILLCTFISFPSTTTAKHDGLDQIQGLDILKDVDIWKDGEITSLGKTFGPDLEEWSGDLHAIDDMSFTALSCLYSSKILNILKKLESDIFECDPCRDDPEPIHSFTDHWGVKQLRMESLQTIAGQMLTTALNFTKIFNIRADKNMLNAIMSFYLFVNNVTGNIYKKYEGLEEKFIDMKLYTRYLIETFAVLNCSWSAFDVGQLDERIHIEDFDRELQNGIPLSLPDTYFKQEYFKPEKLLLTNVSEIRLDSENYKEMSSLGYKNVSTRHSKLRLKRYIKSYATYFISEIITQSQTIVFQCIFTVVFHLINLVFVASVKQHESINSKTDMILANAINVLKRFNFPGLLHVKLRQALYQNMISSKSYEPFNYNTEGTQFTENHIEQFIEHEKLESVNALTEMLEQFSNDLLVMEPEIKLVKEINQMLCDNEYEEVGFLQYDSSALHDDNFLIEDASIEVVIPILKFLNGKNCQFCHIAVVHFILIDNIILQCQAILSDLNNLDMATQLQSCFDSMAKSIKSIEDTIDHSLVAIIDILKSTHPHNNANRKVIDSILAMKLYLNNDNLLNSKVPLTEQGHVDVSQVFSKLDMLKRYNRFIINLIEHYTVHSCSTRSPREMLTKETSTKIDQQCSSVMDENDKTNIIECVDRIIADNLKLDNYDPGESLTNINDFTIENLLMDKVLEKASNNDNGLSMLHELKYSWEGGYSSLTEIVNIVKHNINPKYLYKYQLLVIKAIVFIVYEKLKTIIQSSTSSNDNFQLYRSSMNTIVNHLIDIKRDFFPLGIFRIYTLIVDNFEDYFVGDASVNIDELIRIIEVEQHYLGVQKQSSGAMVDELVLSIPDHTLGTSSKSQDVETVVPSALEMDAQTIIDQLVSYLTGVEDIQTNLTNVALLLDLRRMSSLQI